MQDRYLYKAKGQTDNKWHIGFLTMLSGEVAKITDNEFLHTTWICDSSTLCRCTGLKDKDGKLIWENDILRYSYDYPGSPWLAQKGLTDEDIKYSVGAVFWQDWRGTWAVCGSGKSKLTNQDIYVYSRNPNRVENIGNAIDNPELLEEEKC